MNSTIAAISTPLGSGAIAIIRMSGGQAIEIANALFSPYKIKKFINAEPMKMYLGEFIGKKVKDKCLAVYFKAPYSYTGEDIVEFQVHGGVRLATAILEELLENGCSIADKGEFTRRAFFNDKISLDSAEGILEMIKGESLAAVNAGYRLQDGELSKKIGSVNVYVCTAIAELEVGLDNPDEYGDDAYDGAIKSIKSAVNTLDELIQNSYVVSYAETGIKIAIIGQTNRGKSSLLNALTKTQRAIVTSIAGTTRDVIEESVEYKGYKLIFADTAGLRETQDEVEKIGIARAEDVANSADIIILLSDATDLNNDYDNELIEMYGDKNIIRVYNKCDLVDEHDDDKFYISALNGYNVDKLLEKIITATGIDKIDSTGSLYLNQRHLQSIKKAKDILSKVLFDYKTVTIDCVIVDLNEAVGILSQIDGSKVSAEVVDTIFSKFCVGK